MLSESDLLKSLDDEPGTPSTVDVHRAITAGRRRVVRRGAGYAATAAATALAVAGGLLGTASPHASTGAAASVAPKPYRTIPGTAGRVPPASPPASCTISQLPVPDNAPKALIGGADPAGHYFVGRSYPKAGTYQAVLWHDGTGQDVLLPGDVEENLTDVNSAGTAVGWSYPDKGSAAAGPIPYVYQGGKVVALPGVRHGSAYAVNDAGAIVGEDEDLHAAVVWPSASAKPIRLPVPAGTKEAVARDIDEDGTTVGILDHDRPYVWFPDGTHRELPLPSVAGKPAVTGTVTSVRNGWATGMAASDTGRGDPKSGAAGKATGVGAVSVRWNLRTGEMSVSSVLRYPAEAVNAQGWLIGTGKQGQAVLVAGARTVVLPDLTGHSVGGNSVIPNAVSDDGRTIAGQAENAAGTDQPVVWRCR